ncbi:MAG TPA: hypothetical protein VK735_23220 [Pseudonocardia sp.]|uniref:hypothetical protein n=1 Tax=Pseudonocardia sp. TaxID=60912 RepID=UPI002C858984|nr:hypothetical protein [Pseudonocardia sp.]HTF50361.1 hypothetical protein [Pseudonocardia sp.]
MVFDTRAAAFDPDTDGAPATTGAAAKPDGAAEPDPTAEEITNVIPRFRGARGRRATPPRPRPGPVPNPPPRPVRAPGWPGPGQVPGALPNQPFPSPVGPQPSRTPVPPVGPPRRWPENRRGPVRPPAQLQPPATPLGLPPGVPQVSLPPVPVVNQVISPTPPTATDEPSAVKKAADKLSMSKVLAGSMAAATSAVFGSYFGTLGTVGGAAVGSIATTVATSIYQRSIERTRDTVKTKVLGVTGRGGGDDEVQQFVPVEDERTVRLEAGRAAPAEARPARRPVRLVVAGTFLIFLVGLALVTGIEWAKGSPLSGGTGGTSVGRVLERPAPPTTHREVTPQPEDSSSSEPSSDSSDSSDSDESSQRESSRKKLEDLLPSGSSRPSPSDSPSDSSSPPSPTENLLPRIGPSDSNSGLFQQRDQDQQDR